jgi:hypothetical protein
MGRDTTKGDLKLRAALELERLPIGEHRQRVEEIGRSISHTITFVEASGAPCIPYALGLVKRPQYWSIAEHTGVQARADFMAWLASRLEELDEPAPGALVAYFNNNRWTHLGTMAGTERVISKWGLFPAYQHGLWEVPTSYGNKVKFFSKPDEEEALRLFKEFAGVL